MKTSRQHRLEQGPACATSEKAFTQQPKAWNGTHIYIYMYIYIWDSYIYIYIYMGPPSSPTGIRAK